ncbi:MAG: hypothetical protein AB9866_11810 [Syntrophobacteraceae bacterium]
MIIALAHSAGRSERLRSARPKYAVCSIQLSPTMSSIRVTAADGTNNYGVWNNGSSPVMKDATITASGGGYSYGVYCDNSSPAMTDMTVTASLATNYNFGIYNKLSSAPTMTDIAVTAFGGTSNHGVYNYSASPEMSDVIATASGGNNNYGIRIITSLPSMTNVTATASGGTGSWGIHYINAVAASHMAVRRCTVKGDTFALYSSSDLAPYVTQSSLIGSVHSSTCVACDDGNGNALDASCS